MNQCRARRKQYFLVSSVRLTVGAPPMKRSCWNTRNIKLVAIYKQPLRCKGYRNEQMMISKHMVEEYAEQAQTTTVNHARNSEIPSQEDG